MDTKPRFDAALIAAIVSLSATSAALAADADTKKVTTTEKKQTLKATEKTTTKKAGADSACGKGSCGTDEKGAKAAKNSHAKKVDTKVETSVTKTDKTTK